MIDIQNWSYEEKEAIEKLRKRVENELEPKLLEDVTLYYRFLKARDFHIDKAEKMLRKHILWRRAKQVSTFLVDFEPKEVFLKFLHPKFFGVGKNGDLWFYYPLGNIEAREILKSMLMSNYLDHILWLAEKKISSQVKELNEKKKEIPLRSSPQICFVFDLNKLTLSNTTSKASAEILLRLLGLLQDNFPETMSSLCVINAPRYYVIAFTIMKTIMSKETLQKFSVFGQDGWKDALLQVIDADVLPAFLGGNRTDPDGNPLCNTILSHGGTIPSCYYLSDEDRYFTDKTQVTTITIPKSAKKEVYVDVEKAGSVIQWEFLVKHKDIGFGLFLEKSEVTEILPVQRYDTFDGKASGSYRTKLVGRYILLFDNSFSWLNSKDIEYTIKIINP